MKKQNYQNMGRGLGVGEIPASLTAHAALAAI